MCIKCIKLGIIKYTRRNLFGNWYSYCILLDGKIIRQRYFNNKTKEHRKRIKTRFSTTKKEETQLESCTTAQIIVLPIL